MGWGLALSGGGAKGGAHVGVITALEEEGLRPDLIGGTSAGAIAAGLYAAGRDAKGLREALLELQSIGKASLDPDYPGMILGLFQLLLRREVTLSGILKEEKLWALFDKWTDGKPLSAARLPTVLTAVDINAPKLVLFSSHIPLRVSSDVRYVTDALMGEGIRASTAIPAAFQPLLLDNMRLVDGGVWEAMPVQSLTDLGAARVIGVNVGYDGEARPKVDNLFEIAAQSIDLMGYELQKCRNRMASYTLSCPVGQVGVFDFDKLSEAMDIGYRTAKAHMREIERVLSRAA